MMSSVTLFGETFSEGWEQQVSAARAQVDPLELADWPELLPKYIQP